MRWFKERHGVIHSDEEAGEETWKWKCTQQHQTEGKI